MQKLIEPSKDSEMSDNEGEQEGHPPGVNAGAAEQPLIAQPQIVQPSIRPVANFQGTPPEKFSFKPEEWPKWIQRFERFRKATGLDKQSGESQVNTLIYTMVEQADDIFISFEFTAEQEKSYEEVKERFENHFIVKRNVIFERAKFNSRNQRAGESVDSSSQICTAREALQFWRAKGRAHSRPHRRGFTKPRTFGKTST